MAEPSQGLMEFALFALDHATESVVPSGGPLVPFSLVDVGGERKLTRFAGDLEQGQASAREAIRTSVGLRMAAIAWDGYLTVEGNRSDAVFVEASEADNSESVILAQRYSASARIGNAAMVGRGEPLF